PRGVEPNPQLARGADVNRLRYHLGQRQIGHGDAFDPAERTAAEIDRLEARILGEPRHDRIEHERCDDELLAANELTELVQYLSPLRATGVNSNARKMHAFIEPNAKLLWQAAGRFSECELSALARWAVPAGAL